MNIYENPFVSRKSYFIPIAPARTGKAESKATRGYIIQKWQGKWEIKSGSYYDFSLRNEMPVVGKVSKERLKEAVIACVLAEIKEVQKWSDEHPVKPQKTILQDLLEHYPKTTLDENGFPIGICPHRLGYKDCWETCELSTNCKACWNQPVEDNK